MNEQSVRWARTGQPMMYRPLGQAPVTLQRSTSSSGHWQAKFQEAQLMVRSWCSAQTSGEQGAGWVDTKGYRGRGGEMIGVAVLVGFFPSEPLRTFEYDQLSIYEHLCPNMSTYHSWYFSQPSQQAAVFFSSQCTFFCKENAQFWPILAPFSQF